MPDFWGLATIAAQFALYLGVLAATGTVIAALLFRLEHYRGLCLTFAFLGLCAAILSFSVQGATLTGDSSGMTDPEMLGLLWSTSVGTALTFRVVGLGLVIFGLLVGRLWLSMFGGVLAIWSFGQVGHIASLDGLLPDMALVLHLIAVAFWIGILTPLRHLASSRATWGEATEIGHRFGRIASVTVPLLIIAGGYMSFMLVGSVTALIGTSYGQALILKVLCVAVLLGLAAANKLRFIPGLQAKDPKAARHLKTAISVEWVAILAILAVTATLTSTLTLPK